MNKKLQEIKTENIVIIIYIILLLISIYANKIEVEYIKYQKKEDKQRYRTLLYIVFGVSLIIILYSVIDELNELKSTSNPEIENLNYLSLIANLLALVATAIYLYIVYEDRDINLEVSL